MIHPHLRSVCAYFNILLASMILTLESAQNTQQTHTWSAESSQTPASSWLQRSACASPSTGIISPPPSFLISIWLFTRGTQTDFDDQYPPPAWRWELHVHTHTQLSFCVGFVDIKAEKAGGSLQNNEVNIRRASEMRGGKKRSRAVLVNKGVAECNMVARSLLIWHWKPLQPDINWFRLWKRNNWRFPIIFLKIENTVI